MCASCLLVHHVQTNAPPTRGTEMIDRDIEFVKREWSEKEDRRLLVIQLREWHESIDFKFWIHRHDDPDQ